ncbi:magnesium transporter [Exiguobacterium sp. PvP048]|uniref:Magnesium transport protein CorA n=1 Tax=Exiguobacterium sibiricum (strain DSM 17290 / CCUG 55495 / CIP 109462 / JCM 13490 / 255-15) TaxID=262543 RepID=B1YH66_EXIS2|nr:magnesium/cobalt transporter CorA [Exiguobacterium sibiricum]ACB61127.1 magnesium and cobalt transport protein CorA [Exiguobacterium sibiricum 255-15]
MIRCLLVTTDHQVVMDDGLGRIHAPDIKWYFVDFNQPTEQEKQQLISVFDFHPLALEDCFQYLQRPKLEYYDGYSFFVLHALDTESLKGKEINLFVNENYVVSYHEQPSSEIDVVFQAFQRLHDDSEHWTIEIVHKIMDKIVDGYFPIVHALEDKIFALEGRYEQRGNDKRIMEEIFEIRSDLLVVARTLLPMRDLLYRVVESRRLAIHANKKAFFQDIYDHLLKLNEMIEYNREMTSEFRDNFISLNSYRMNNIMKTLTIFTTIFMPLTFIAGIYGMNFEHMPELTTRFGYFFTLGGMAVIALGMIVYFRKNHWFDE